MNNEKNNEKWFLKNERVDFLRLVRGRVGFYSCLASPEACPLVQIFINF